MTGAGEFAGTWLADIVLMAMAVEFVVLVLRGRTWRATGVALLPGAFLTLALRAGLGGAAWQWVALPLALSWPAHLLDLRHRGWLGRKEAGRVALSPFTPSR